MSVGDHFKKTMSLEFDIASISAGTNVQVAKMSGMDTAMYRKKQRNCHTYLWKQCPMWAGEFINHPISEMRAGAANLVCKVDTDCDEIFTGYFYVTAPAIKGIKHRNQQRFPTVKHSKLRAADRRIGKKFARTLPDNDDDPDYVRSGVDAFLRKNYGGNGDMREPLPCEEETVRSGRSGKTRDTRTPGNAKYYAYYISDWVKEAIPTYSIKVAGNVVNTIVNKFAHIMLDLCYSESKRMGLREMTGYANTQEELIARSSEVVEGWYPMWLWQKHIETSLKTCYMDWAPITYYITTSPFEKLIVRANKNTKVVKLNGQELQPIDLQACVVLHEIVLDEETQTFLRDQGNFDILIKQHTYKTFTSDYHKCDIKTSHPVIAYWWLVHRAAAEEDNLPFHWWGALDREPIKNVRIKFGNKDRQRRQPAMLYRLIQPLEKHTSCPTPTNCYYMYGFAFNVESTVPDGSFNSIRLQQVILDITLQDGLEGEDVTVWVFAENWMMLKHVDRTAYPLFQ